MYQFLVLHSLSIDQTLVGQRLLGVTEPLGKMMCCGIKIYSTNVVVFETVHSLSTKANHLGFNKPFSYFLVRCNLSAC